MPALALTLGFVLGPFTPRESGLPALAALAALIGLTTTVVASCGAGGVAQRILKGMTLGTLAGASLIVGDYLAFCAGLGYYAQRASWSGEAGRSLSGFIIAYGALGALVGSACGLLAACLHGRMGRRPGFR